MRMGGDRKAEFASFVDNRGQLFVGKGALARVGVRGACALCSQNLDEVYMVFGIGSHDTAQIVGSAKTGRKPAHGGKIQQESGEGLGEIGPDLVTRSDDAWKIRHAAVVQFTYADVCEVIDAHDSHCSGSILQRATGSSDIEEVGVRIHISGQEPVAFEVYNLSASRYACRPGGHAFNPGTSHHDCGVTRRFRRDTVDQTGMDENQNCFRALGADLAV